MLSVGDLRDDFGGGEPRVQDLVLAEALGFEKPVNIRKLIRRHFDELNGDDGGFSMLE